MKNILGSYWWQYLFCQQLPIRAKNSFQKVAPSPKFSSATTFLWPSAILGREATSDHSFQFLKVHRKKLTNLWTICRFRDTCPHSLWILCGAGDVWPLSDSTIPYQLWLFSSSEFKWRRPTTFDRGSGKPCVRFVYLEFVSFSPTLSSILPCFHWLYDYNACRRT